MKTFTMTHCLGCIVLMIALVHAKPTTPHQNEERTSVVSHPENDPNEDSLLVVPFEEMEVIPVIDAATQNGDDELLDTANARYYSDYYFRPVYSIRRTQSNRRRVYVPRRRYSGNEDRFPTVT